MLRSGEPPRKAFLGGGRQVSGLGVSGQQVFWAEENARALRTQHVPGVFGDQLRGPRGRSKNGEEVSQREAGFSESGGGRARRGL